MISELATGLLQGRPPTTLVHSPTANDQGCSARQAALILGGILAKGDAWARTSQNQANQPCCLSNERAKRCGRPERKQGYRCASWRGNSATTPTPRCPHMN